MLLSRCAEAGTRLGINTDDQKWTEDESWIDEVDTYSKFSGLRLVFYPSLLNLVDESPSTTTYALQGNVDVLMRSVTDRA